MTTEYQIEKWPSHRRTSILLLCTEHLLNPSLAEESWDNPYSRDEAIEIIRAMFLHEGYNEKYVESLINPLEVN